MTGPSKRNVAIKSVMRKANESLKAGEAGSGEVIAILSIEKQEVGEGRKGKPNCGPSRLELAVIII